MPRRLKVVVALGPSGLTERPDETSRRHQVPKRGSCYAYRLPFVGDMLPMGTLMTQSLPN